MGNEYLFKGRYFSLGTAAKKDCIFTIERIWGTTTGLIELPVYSPESLPVYKTENGKYILRRLK